MTPPRTTDAQVKAIINTQLDTTPFIETATLLVDQYCLGAGLSDELLTTIETWWAAHLVAIREPRLRSKQLGETTVAYQQGTLGFGLMSTAYGQTVLMFYPPLATATTVQHAALYVD